MMFQEAGAADRSAQRQRSHPIAFGALCALAVVATLIIKGRLHVDQPEMLLLHNNPWGRFGADWESYLYGSLLNPFIGFFLGIKTAGAIRAFYTDLAVAACMIIPVAYYIRNPVWGKTALYLYCLTPLSFVLISWLGKSDPFLLASYAIVFFFRWPAIQALGIGLAVLAHKEQSLIIISLHLLLQRKHSFATIAATAIGVMTALAVHKWYQHYLPVVPRTRLAFFLSTNAQALKLNGPEIPIEVFSVFGVFWLPLWRHFAAVSGARRYKLLAACAVAVLLPLTTYDYTRVAAMLALPIYLHVIDFWVVERDATAAEACGLKEGMLIPLLLIAFMAATHCQAYGFLNNCDCLLHNPRDL
jgi:hypothetical protein